MAILLAAYRSPCVLAALSVGKILTVGRTKAAAGGGSCSFRTAKVVVPGRGPTRTNSTSVCLSRGRPLCPGPALLLKSPRACEIRRSKAMQIPSEDRTEFSRPAYSTFPVNACADECRRCLVASNSASASKMAMPTESTPAPYRQWTLAAHLGPFQVSATAATGRFNLTGRKQSSPDTGRGRSSSCSWPTTVYQSARRQPPLTVLVGRVNDWSRAPWRSAPPGQEQASYSSAH